MSNNRGIEVNDDGSYSVVKSRKIRKSYIVFDDQAVVAKDRHSARRKFIALNCKGLEEE